MSFLHTFYRKYLVVCGLVACCFLSNAQKYDYTWLSGYSSQGGYDSVNYHYWFGISKFDFSQSPMLQSYDSLGINFDGAGNTISDNNGTLKFYTNGVTVRNSLDEIIADSLHNGYFLNHLPTWYYYGNPIDILVLTLPNPKEIGTYDILYGWGDTLSNGDVTVKELKRTSINMDLNLGRGLPLYIDRPFSKSESAFVINAVKHANGKDWWLITMLTGTNCFDLMLYDGTDSIMHIRQECKSNFNYKRAEYCSLTFSPNGSYLMSVADEKGKINFFEFDRCNGTLSLIEEVDFPEKFDSTNYLFFGASYSPNSRYAYICANKRIYQFDMLATPIASSKTTIANYIPYLPPAPLTYNHSQLAPDGKIYISSRNTTYYVAVINNPDMPGAACNFQDTVKVPSFIAGLPYYPNYRLGALAGSACDTITTLTPTLSQRERELKVFPNPATDAVTVDYGFTNWEKGDVDLEITNAAGQLVHSQHLPMYSGFQRLDVMQYAAGVYNVAIKRGNAVVSVSQFVKQ
jgi:hypothetical protein